jgi:hypothetical protein
VNDEIEVPCGAEKIHFAHSPVAVVAAVKVPEDAFQQVSVTTP